MTNRTMNNHVVINITRHQAIDNTSSTQENFLEVHANSASKNPLEQQTGHAIGIQQLTLNQ